LYEFPRDREKIKIACAENDPDGNGMLVERFRSPITFKVFDQNIYMLPEAITDKIYDKKFSFTNSRKSTIELRTPKKGDFDLLEFLENHVDKSWEYVSNK
jgi:hypothetical protein